MASMKTLPPAVSLNTLPPFAPGATVFPSPRRKSFSQPVTHTRYFASSLFFDRQTSTHLLRLSALTLATVSSSFCLTEGATGIQLGPLGHISPYGAQRLAGCRPA